MNYYLIGKLIGYFYWFYSITFRYQLRFSSNIPSSQLHEYLSSGESDPPFIFAIWHQDEMSALPFFQRLGIRVMVSKSKDGDLLAGALDSLGYRSSRGSSSKNAVSAYLGIMRALNKKESVCLAIDGPRGPIYQAKQGIIDLSNRLKLPILPVLTIPKHFHTFDKSWSKSRLPYPFSKITISIGRYGYYESAAELKDELNRLKNFD